MTREEGIRQVMDERGLESASRIIVFSYSAPKIDVEAIELMGNGRGSPNRRNLEQIEIINLQAKHVVVQRWNGLIHSDHHAYGAGYFKSVLTHFPRRTGEAYMH
jgi:hypothetical protein